MTVPTCNETRNRPDLSAAWAKIDALDLEPVVFKLMHPDPGEPGLMLADADQAVDLYRCFLKLCVLRPEVSLVPTRAIDRVWHAHLLDTAKYRTDCHQVFGRILDHFPYAGLRGEADEAAWSRDFIRTRQLFREQFDLELDGEPTASVCRVHDDGSDCCVTGVTSAAKASNTADPDLRPRPVRTTADPQERR